MHREDLENLREYATVLEALHRNWQPHPGQVPIGRALFVEGAKQIFIRAGRRTGKTEIALYSMVRWAATHPDSACYVIGPMQRQIREIAWVSGRLQNMVPKELLRGGSIETAVNNTEMRIWLANGSFIKCDGSDHVDSLRGLRMNILFIDEYKNCRPDLIDVLRPTLLDFGAPMLVAGTPSDIEDHYVKLDREAQNSSEWKWFKLPTSANPYIPKELLEKEHKRYEENGELDVWQREYEAEIVLGGKRAIFPMFSDEVHVKPFETLLASVRAHEDQWSFYVANDPGTASVFASLLVAINNYDGRVFVLDEVYETLQSLNSTGRIWPRVMAKQKEIYVPDRGEDPWLVVYDEAATWFRNELLDQFEVSAIPSEKAKNKKADGLSLIKDLLNKKRLLVSSRCVHLIREIKAYRLNDQGLPLKKDDHAADALRYSLGASHYSMQETTPPVKEVIPIDEQRQAFTPEEDWAALFAESQPYLSDDLNDSDIY